MKSPKDRLALGKEIPALVAARGKSGHGRKTGTYSRKKRPKSLATWPKCGGSAGSSKPEVTFKKNLFTTQRRCVQSTDVEITIQLNDSEAEMLRVMTANRNSVSRRMGYPVDLSFN